MRISNLKSQISNFLAIVLLVGCESGNPAYRTTAAPAHEIALEEPLRSPEPEEDQEPRDTTDVIALISGKPLRVSQIQPLLIESSGGQVLSELVLDEQIARELQKREMAVSDEDIANEKSLILSRVPDDPDQGQRLLEQMRQRLQVGPRRFEMHFRRNAALRKLVASEVVVSDAMVRQAYEQQKAPQAECRLILVESLKGADQVLKRLKAGESFIDLAIELSTDPSRNQGGLLPPIAPWDATFPAAVTATAAKLEPGQISDPIALDNGFAILRCERKMMPESKPFEQVQAAIRSELKLSVERSLMQRKARVLLQQADVTVLDGELDREFKARRNEAVEQK